MSLQDYQVEMERCSQCSYCWWIPLDQIKSLRFARGCPSVTFNHFNSYSARGKYAVALSLLKGKSQYTPQVLDIVYKCQTCGSCDIACKVCRYNLEPLETILELRAKLVEDGQLLPAHLPIIESLSQEYNMVQGPHAERGKWAEGLSVKNISEGQEAEVVFFAGCKYSYDESLQKNIRSAITLIQKAGVDIGVMAQNETCCGGRAYQMGYRKEFKSCADKIIKTLEKSKTKKIVTSCADCYHSFKRLYPKIGLDIEVLHTVEYIESLSMEGKISYKNPIDMTVTYHDPCHLGRLGEPYIPWSGAEKKVRNQIVVYEPKKPRNNGALGIYDPPRRMLQSIPGLNLVEMERNREYAWCCGAGGGVREAYPEFSQWTASERVEEAKSTGAEAIVSACPWCERNLIDAVSGMGEKLKVYDIIELISLAT